MDETERERGKESENERIKEQKPRQVQVHRRLLLKLVYIKSFTWHTIIWGGRLVFYIYGCITESTNMSTHVCRGRINLESDASYRASFGFYRLSFTVLSIYTLTHVYIHEGVSYQGSEGKKG